MGIRDIEARQLFRGGCFEICRFTLRKFVILRRIFKAFLPFFLRASLQNCWLYNCLTGKYVECDPPNVMSICLKALTVKISDCREAHLHQDGLESWHRREARIWPVSCGRLCRQGARLAYGSRAMIPGAKVNATSTSSATSGARSLMRRAAGDSFTSSLLRDIGGHFWKDRLRQFGDPNCHGCHPLFVNQATAPINFPLFPSHNVRCRAPRAKNARQAETSPRSQDWEGPSSKSV